MQVGICGLPGSGKSTVFAALAPRSRTERGVARGNIKVPDNRVDRLARIFNPRKTTYGEIDFVDVGGHAGPSRGAFPPRVLEAMRSADVLVHVVRLFNNPMLDTPADPARDVDLFSDELLLLDMAIMERRVERFRKENKKDMASRVATRCLAWLEESRPLRLLELTHQERQTLQGIQLLSAKPLIVLYNMGEDEWEQPQFQPLKPIATPEPHRVTMGLCGLMEAEIATLEPEEQQEFLDALGLQEPARNTFIQAAFRLLDLISFLTCGPDECRAWPIPKRWVARRAAGRIHSDLERGFIRAEVYSLEDLEREGSEAALKQKGLIRLEGANYVVRDGDILHVRFNV